MIFKIKSLICTTIATLFLVACGGGGTSTTTYQVLISGTVTGLPAGQQLTLVTNLPTTNQTLPIVITQNGTFNSQITLPAGYTLTNSGVINATITQQPNSAYCNSSFVNSTAITIACTSSNTAAGFYTGPQTTTGATLGTNYAYAFIKNNGEFYYVPAVQTTFNNFKGLIYGTGTSANNIFTSTNAVDTFSNPLLKPTLRANYISQTSFTSTIQYQNATLSGTLTAPNASTYSFITSPNLSAISGTYTLSMANSVSSYSMNLVVSSTGSFSGSNSAGCAISGIFTPMATGENAYNASFTYGPSPCKQANATDKGFVLLYTGSGQLNLFGAVLNSSATDGMLLAGTKQ